MSYPQRSVLIPFRARSTSTHRTWGSSEGDARDDSGNPLLPVVDRPDADEEPERGVHWKTVSLTKWATRRPFVWLDDEITDANRRWVAAHHSQPALLHRVDPFLGLTGADVAVARHWLGQRDEAG